MLLSSYSWSLGTCLSFLSGSILYIWPLTSITLVFLQCVETEFFQLFVGRCLQKPRPAPVWRTRCRFKTYFIVRWGSRLYGQDKEIAGILGEGSFVPPTYFCFKLTGSLNWQQVLPLPCLILFAMWCRWRALWSLGARKMFLKRRWVPCLLWRRHWTSWLHLPTARLHCESLGTILWCGS